MPDTLTREEYDRLPAEQQGYVSYMQAAWNREIPEECPYDKQSTDHKLWWAGQMRAMLEAQDEDDS